MSKKLFCIILQLKLFSRKLTLLIETSVKFPSLMQMQLGRRILFIILICLWIDYADSCCINLDNWNIPQQFNWNNFACFFVSWWKGKRSCGDTCTQFLIFNAWKVLWNWIVFSQNSFVISPGLLYHQIKRDTRGKLYCKRGLYIKSCYFFEIIASRIKNDIEISWPKNTASRF